MAGCKNQLNMKYRSKLLVSNICHIEIIICIRKFRFWVEFAIKHYKQQPAHIRF